YWAWDPVENASFMPWLTATAFLHSVMVQERRGMLRVWNLSLIITTFLLTILGTFLTRSGIISSVHAFTQGSIGYFFLIFIGLVLAFSLVVLAGRAGELNSAGTLDRIAARPTVFLINNLLLTAFCFTVLLGTLFPLIAEAACGVKVSVGAPFFNRMTIPLVVALLFLIGVGPILPWRGGALADLRRKLALPAAAGIVAATLSIVFGAREPYTILAFSFAAFALTANLQEFAEGTSARMRAHGEPIVQALVRLVRANPRRYGGYTAHIGLIIAAVGIAGSSTFKIEREATLKPGQSMAIGEYTVRFDQLWAKEDPHRFAIGADLVVLKTGKPVGTMEPKLNYYSSRDEPVPTPFVRSGARNDLYANLLAFERNGSSATMHVLVEPLVSWIWVGGLIVALGALVGVVVPERKAKRAARATAARATAEDKAVAA
ncbi:MAG TPA: cytochrome c-type biogenesis CcmF C-terminal domain-containing protein, partial [Longimicrobiales bacterium]|nr:cytochrome c-type biogenesis CcmF C-terminal domain-containing protein [Longimicrobiales bacterium]